MNPSHRSVVSSGPSKTPNCLAQQYGGSHTGSWVGHLPSTWIPYVQLARLSPPAGVFLVFFPHLFGIIHAAIMQRSSIQPTLRACALMMGASFFLSNAIHGWNDLVDAPVDKLVVRTRGRPIVRGAISPSAAFIFTITQAFLAAAFLLVLPDIVKPCIIPGIFCHIYYPWSKRHTHFAQMVLGFCLGWGVIVGTGAMGIEPWSLSTTCLFVSCILWTTIYDTIYGYQDIKDDQKIGLKSTAVLFRERTKDFLWVMLSLLLILLTIYGRIGMMGFQYYIIAVGGCLISLGVMVANVELENPLSCWWWFRYGFWLAGGSIAGGLLSEYAMY
ncbi:hypothetical protein M434DRAFT_85456 [Hypoxylon sp. CO27-5]|nr:hypothetical protein M434DRAFT_85456 [Hypoxylon sp. CO27-5]